MGALVVALGCVLTLGPGAGAARTNNLTLRPRARTQHACAAVTGPRARCAAIEVLDADAVAAGSRVHGQPARRRPPATTTTSSSTTTSTSTSTTSTSIPTAGCTTAHSGYTPCDLRSAYALTSSGGAGQTVAIVDAYDDPNAAADLGVYRTAYGLPACTTSNGCFRKVDQNGGTNYPVANTGWAEEISLDLDMVSAVCPNCHILLVEASSNSLNDLLLAENRAATLGATVISNSWGANEFSSESLYDSYFKHGIPITASSGDAGYGVEWPASSPYVTSVGGTSIVRSTGARGWAETAWSGAGSGCSAYESKPAFQTDASCARRTVADVSAIADPNTGVAVYDSYRVSGWLVFGGTSVAAPVVASVYALAGNGASISSAGYVYGHRVLNDVVSGGNGSCGGTYLCTAGPGYDGPTGLGTPNGTAAF
jgi:subtilase family serine protease